MRYALVFLLLLPASAQADCWAYNFKQLKTTWEVYEDLPQVTRNGCFELSWEPTEVEINRLHSEMWTHWVLLPGFRLKNVWLTYGNNQVYFHVLERPRK